MRTLGIILALHAFILGMALSMAGVATLSMPSNADTEGMRREFEEARKKGRLGCLLHSAGVAASARMRGLALLVAHWPERAKGRKLVYLGAAFVAAAAAIGFSFGLFDN